MLAALDHPRRPRSAARAIARRISQAGGPAQRAGRGAVLTDAPALDFIDLGPLDCSPAARPTRSTYYAAARRCSPTTLSSPTRARRRSAGAGRRGPAPGIDVLVLTLTAAPAARIGTGRCARRSVLARSRSRRPARRRLHLQRRFRRPRRAAWRCSRRCCSSATSTRATSCCCAAPRGRAALHRPRIPRRVDREVRRPGQRAAVSHVSRLFAALPLGARIGADGFVVHGGVHDHAADRRHRRRAAAGGARALADGLTTHRGGDKTPRRCFAACSGQTGPKPRRRRAQLDAARRRRALRPRRRAFLLRCARAASRRPLAPALRDWVGAPRLRRRRPTLYRLLSADYPAGGAQPRRRAPCHRRRRRRRRGARVRVGQRRRPRRVRRGGARHLIARVAAVAHSHRLREALRRRRQAVGCPSASGRRLWAT